ncbi:hypothetical protein C8A01DRAFT_17413 [Parachaetomium inaequale]|uniref:F-box domain-containing protein n=1 Tax=Parachaetomium inaequale TaxID=2588326 RepID=A0AAN6PCT0_9PEZI|nr:hypothetical protein C8A01DRAFT_17413 [Parachaetomium inaequale]
MLATMTDLKRTMDPLVAAQVYNRQHNPLCRLPDELLLLILPCIGDDHVALYCTRRVSRVLRHLIHDPAVWRYTEMPLSLRFSYLSESHWEIPEKEKTQLKRHLRADGMCDNCKLWCDVPVKGWSKRLDQYFKVGPIDPDWMARMRLTNPTCKFDSPITLDAPVHCRGCGLHHADWVFPPGTVGVPRQPYDAGEPNQLCLGHRGTVQLCEHTGVSWRAVEDHMTNWQDLKRGYRTWQACLDDFAVECRHPIHDRRCRPAQAPTWPRARLQTSRNHETTSVVLVLEWAPHSGVGAFVRGPHGRPLAAELRSLFQGYRQQGQPAEILMPARLGQLPEMVCFDPNTCRCLHYETGNSIDDPQGQRAADAADLGFLSLDCLGRHSHRNDIRLYGDCDRTVEMRQHWPRRGREPPPCLITTYRHRVVVCDDIMAWTTGPGGTKLHPTHEWFHAMDPDTYPRPLGHELPLCKDRGCMNYYKRPRMVSCIEPRGMFSPCQCPRQST